MYQKNHKPTQNEPRNPFLFKIFFIFKNKIRYFLEKLNYDLLEIRYFIENSCGFLGEDFDDLHIYVMALEDRRFTKHCGVDFKAVIRETLKLLCGKRYGGASTIDMQMVRTITGFKEKTFKRKIYEMTLSYFINIKYTKKQIIDCYLENAFFGSGLIGVENVIHNIFKKDSLEDLTEKEKASIAAMLQKPRPLNPSYAWKCDLGKRAFYAESVRSRVKGFN